MRRMDLQAKYPGIDDLRTRAQKRIPHFVFEYLDSGTAGSHHSAQPERA